MEANFMQEHGWQVSRRDLADRRGVTLVETLVVVAVIGGVASLLLPAINQARESARAMTCQNNLKQIGIGLHGFHVARDSFPANVSGNGARYYWTAQILPYVEENQLASIYDYTTACNDIKNQTAVQTPLGFMCCPSNPGGRLQDPNFKKTGSPTWGAAAADYASPTGPSVSQWTSSPASVSYPQPASIEGMIKKGTVKPGVKGRRMSEITDGTSRSIAVIESAGRPQIWNSGKKTADSGVPLCAWADTNQFDVRGFQADASKTFGPQMINGGNNYGIYAFHPGGAQLLFADGSVRFVVESTSADIVAALLTVRGGDAVTVP
jgi:prepilin-type N-terminal cleavage/methylation domain-containing protein/prepilin-type processing-associated H-X9-DG protein